MVETFVDREPEYLAWLQANPDGFVVNCDEPNSNPTYPMVHRARHGVVSSAQGENYTTGRYFKVCGSDLGELEAWAGQNYGRPLNRCRSCM